MLRLVVVWWLARTLDGLLGHDRFAARWHAAFGALAGVTALGAAADAVFHFWGAKRHLDALRGQGPCPCRH